MANKNSQKIILSAAIIVCAASMAFFCAAELVKKPFADKDNIRRRCPYHKRIGAMFMHCRHFYQILLM